MEEKKVLVDEQMEEVTGGRIIRDPGTVFRCRKCGKSLGIADVVNEPFCAECRSQMQANLI